MQKPTFDSSFLLGQRTRSPLFDEAELQSEAVQRVWQYLRLYNKDPTRIQHFNFDARNKRDDNPEECLETLIGFVSFNFTCFFINLFLNYYYFTNTDVTYNIKLLLHTKK